MFAFLLAAFGLVTIVTKSSLFDPLRLFMVRRAKPLAPLVTCPMCFGFWAGVALALLGLGPHVSHSWWRELLAGGWISSGWCWSVHAWLARIIAAE